MKEQIINFYDKFGLPRLIITLFVILVLIVATTTDLNIGSLLSDSLVRIGMNGIFVLAMIPSIQSGNGLNFGLPVGILSGIVGTLIAMENKLVGFGGFAVALFAAIPIAIIAGYIYAQLLNRVVGQEMMVGTYVGFAIVAGMCIFWLTAPFKNPAMIWAIGGEGLRTTLTLADSFTGVLNKALVFKVFGISVPTGLLLFFAFMAFLVWVFAQSKHGVAMEMVGRNPRFAVASGLKLNKYRTLGTVLSTVLAAIGYVVYAQSFGFVQLYMGPLMMAFPAVAGILIGGASTTSAKVAHGVIGVILFQTLLTVGMPVANKVIAGNISEIARVIISNGMILYALTRTTGGDQA
ncbi:MAG TPA: ABC transporter permease [Natronincola sp.]|nr:ABC transporter permease [Natronincola sp.]